VKRGGGGGGYPTILLVLVGDSNSVSHTGEPPAPGIHPGNIPAVNNCPLPISGLGSPGDGP